jgi:hypothetical protein
MRDGTTVQDIRQLFPLSGAQLGGPATPMPLQQSFFTMLVPSPDPSVSTGAIHLQGPGDVTGGQPLDTEHDGLQPQGNTGCVVSLGSLPQRFEALECARIASCKDGLHSRKTYVVLLIREPVQHIFMPRSKGKSHLRFENPFLGSHFDK